MLRIQRLRLSRGDAEELGIELIHLPEKPSLRRRLARRRGGQQGVPVGRRGADGVDSITQQPPEILQALNPTGKPAARSDDRDRLAAGTFGLSQTFLEPFDREERFAQDIPALAHRSSVSFARNACSSSDSVISGRRFGVSLTETGPFPRSGRSSSICRKSARAFTVG